MKVEMIVKVDGRVVGEHQRVVAGTLEQMEESIITLTRQAGASALQGSVDAVAAPRPLFRKTKVPSGTGGTGRGRSWGSMGRSPSGGRGSSAR